MAVSSKDKEGEKGGNNEKEPKKEDLIAVEATKSHSSGSTAVTTPTTTNAHGTSTAEETATATATSVRAKAAGNGNGSVEGGADGGTQRRRGRDPRPKNLHVDLDEGVLKGKEKDEDDAEKGENGEEKTEKTGEDSKDAKKAFKVPPFLQWTVDNWTWTKLKPAIRCAIVAWISALLFIIPDVQKVMGQAAFLILISAVLSPPSDPFIAVVEREFLILLFVSTSWAWSCLGMKLASLSRSSLHPEATFAAAITGQYIEAGQSAILLVFLFIGTCFWLYIRAVQGPGPYLFPCVFAVICLDICLTTSAIFPYPYYLLGKTVIVPLTIHTGICLLGSIIIFPSTTSALFTTRLAALLGPMITALDEHKTLLSTSPLSPSFATLASSISSQIDKSEAQILPLAAATRLLGKDLIWGRYSPRDYKPFQDMARRMTNRGNGLSLYFSLIDPTRQRFPVTPAPSSPAGSRAMSPVGTGYGTPPWSRNSSRAPSRVVSRVQSRAASPERGGSGAHTATPPTASTPATPHLEHPITRSVTHTGTSTPILLEHSISRPQTATSTPTGGSATPTTTAPGAHHARFMMDQRTDSIQSISASASKRSQYFREHGFGGSIIHPHRREKSRDRHHKRCGTGDKGEKEKGDVDSVRSKDHHHKDSGAHHGHHSHHYWRHHHHHLLHHALHSLSFSLSQDRFETLVGVFESQKYMNLEASKFTDPDAEKWTVEMTELLGESCTPLIETLSTSLKTVQTWLTTARHDRLRYLFNPRKVKEEWDTEREKHVEMREELGKRVGEFRGDLRFRVLDPYRKAFESKLHRMSSRRKSRMNRTQSHRSQDEKDAADDEWETFPVEDAKDDEDDLKEEPPAHRYLFHCFVYQYHLIQLAEIVCEMMDEMIRLEKKRQGNRLWTPVQRLIRWRHWEVSDAFQLGDGDEDPDAIQGLDPAILEDLGLPMRRDPDALPPRNLFESIMSWVYHSVTGLAGGNVLYAIKAGILAVVLSLPSVLKGSAEFAYNNRFVWGIIMGQITLARFRGDTIFGFFARVVSTFLGGAVGMVMWYISCGSGRGNPYGLAVVFGICCPLIFYARLYYPGPPMTQIVFCVTICLVVGYSYLDVTQVVPGSPGFGFTVWWRRCLLVTVGVFAASIVSFLPPSTTIRKYQRATLATTCSELGAIYCTILSYANDRSPEQIQEINTSILAVRSKLKRSIVLRTNVIYEFSLRGRWPVKRYQALCDIQIQIAYSLAHFMSVIKHLEPAWAKALLRRTRFTDTDFQGEILAVLTMISSALRTGHPLPQITPCPLLDRFLAQSSGLDILKKETEEDYGLPRTLTLETLMNEQYLYFCVGVSTAFSIMTRLDRLMVAAKEIVGEHYHIHGIGLAPTVTRQMPGYVATPEYVQYRPPQAEEV